MSSSDYIKFKRTGVILKNLQEEPYILDDSEYIDFKNYNLENTITNSKIIYNKLKPSNHQIVFNMEMTTTNCPTFILCKNTNTRSNRKAILRTQAAPKPKPKYIKNPMYFTESYKTLCMDNQSNAKKCKLCTNALCCGCKPIPTSTSQGCKSFNF